MDIATYALSKKHAMNAVEGNKILGVHMVKNGYGELLSGYISISNDGEVIQMPITIETEV